MEAVVLGVVDVPQLRGAARAAGRGARVAARVGAGVEAQPRAHVQQLPRRRVAELLRTPPAHHSALTTHRSQDSRKIG